MATTVLPVQLTSFIGRKREIAEISWREVRSQALNHAFKLLWLPQGGPEMDAIVPR